MSESYVLDSYAVLVYADAFAVATAIDRNAAVITGDPEIKSVESV